ncbi:MAG: DUF429 domain-containing protein [Chloroflexi bacterium]|nr:DUF429 domain-containing protein [Chloroflexota bacterium]
MTTIIGVDFSGAKSDRNTWATVARLEHPASLHVDSAQRIPRADLYDLLVAVPTPAVAALDFPFGVPAQFASSIAAPPAPTDMPDLWRAVQPISAVDFIAARNTFVAVHGEPKRAGDFKYHRESYSPLHNVNPNMLPMTWHGIQLLHRWHQEHPRRWYVPPLPAPAPPENVVTLLELMPGALLRALALPFKGYKRGRDSAHRRTQILDNLAAASGVALPDLDSVRDDCLANDDCLDSVVAAVGAAMWAQDSSRFRHPTDDELLDAKLEGWIYVPNLD